MILAKDIPDIIRANFDFVTTGDIGRYNTNFNTKTDKRLGCYYGFIKGINIYNSKGRNLVAYRTEEDSLSPHRLRFFIL